MVPEMAAGSKVMVNSTGTLFPLYENSYALSPGRMVNAVGETVFRVESIG